MEELGARERLLAVATELFAARGFADVSVRDIATGAETNVAMVSYYFGGKEGLYREVFLREAREVESLRAILVEGNDPKETIRRFSRALTAMHSRRPALASLFHQEVMHPSPLLQEIVAPRLSLLAQGLRGIVDRGVAEGFFRNGSPSLLGAYALAAMLNYFFLFHPLISLVLPDLQALEPAPAEAFADGICDLWFRGMEADRGA